MKTIRFFIISLFLLALSACQTPFEKEYDLSVDSNEYIVTINGKTFPVYVYCSSSWTASFDAPVDWAEIIEGESGTGVGMVKLHVQANYGEARSVNLVLRSETYEQVIIIRQKEFAVDYYATFVDKEQLIASGSYLAKVRMMTNIPPEVLASSRAVADVEWISGVTPYAVISDNQVIGTNRKVEVEFSFVVSGNHTGTDRTALFSLGVPSEYTDEMERVQTLTLVQTADQAYMTADAVDAYLPDAQECTITISTNLLPVCHDMNVLTDAEFVSEERLETDGQNLFLKFSLSANKSGNARNAKFVLSYRDLDGVKSVSEITIQQN